MKISEIGGEFALINKINNIVGKQNVVVGIGDDAAVIEYSKDKYLLLTTDMLVEDDHFSLNWSSAFKIGKKAMVSNISDIAAMGGMPRYALVSLSLKKDSTVEFVEELYKGMKEICEKADCVVIGGDTTHGGLITISITIVGEVEKDKLRLRKDAKVNDLICVTGDLGKSAAGLALLQNNKKGFLKDHLEPNHRLKESQIIREYCNALIDVSDGLASEVKHICEMSKTGAIIYKEKIPLSKTTIENAKIVDKDPYDFALYGGEDFELVFTITEDNFKKLQDKLKNITIVGKIIDEKEGIFLVGKDNKISLKNGFDHFK